MKVRTLKNINHLAPLYNFYKRQFLCPNLRTGSKYMVFKLCTQLIPELECDFYADYPFNPKHIPKVAQRRIRKACYQSFALYKRSFKPRPKPKLKMIRDEWKIDDMAAAFLYAYFSEQGQTRQNFEKQYLCTWDLAAENPRNEF